MNGTNTHIILHTKVDSVIPFNSLSNTYLRRCEYGASTVRAF